MGLLDIRHNAKKLRTRATTENFQTITHDLRSLKARKAKEDNLFVFISCVGLEISAEAASSKQHSQN